MRLPRFFARIARHADLFERMTEKLNVDGQMNLLPNAASVKKRAANRCLGCSKAEECTAWLALPVTRQEAPDYCRNQGLFARLKNTRDVERTHL